MKTQPGCSNVKIRKNWGSVWMTARRYLINNVGQAHLDTELGTLTIDMQAHVKAGVALVLYGMIFCNPRDWYHKSEVNEYCSIIY
jgi:hypothetical protein